LIGGICSLNDGTWTQSRPEKKNGVRKQADKNNSNRVTKNLLSTVHQERADWSVHLPCEQWGRQSTEGAVIHEPATSETISLADPTAIDRYQIQPKTAHVTLENNRTHQRLVLDLHPPGSLQWYAVTTWTEKADSDFYCIEPWLGLPNAIHHGEGLRYLAPDAKDLASLVLDASGW